MEQKVNEFLRLIANEFLRFNDLHPATKRQVFVYALIALGLGFTFLQTITWWIGVIFPDLNVVMSIFGQAILQFFVIPISALLFRRLSDTRLLAGVFKSWFGLRAGSAGSKIVFWVIGIGVFSIVGFCLFIAPVLSLMVGLVLALLPSEPQENIERKPNVVPAASGLSTPPILGIPRSNGTPQATKSATAHVFTRTIKPSKLLFRRMGFWLSVVVGLSAIAMQVEDLIIDSLRNSGSSQTIDPTVTPQNDPVTESTVVSTSSPVATTTQSSITASVSTGFSGDESLEEDDVLLVPGTGDDEFTADLDPRFRFCTHAIAAGYGPYVAGIDPEYSWYNDRDGDGIVCER